MLVLFILIFSFAVACCGFDYLFKRGRAHFDFTHGDYLSKLFCSHPFIFSCVVVVCLLITLSQSHIVKQFLPGLQYRFDGQYCYAVELFSDDKHYTLPASISVSGKSYYLDSVFWPNGNCLSFSNCEIYPDNQTAFKTAAENETQYTIVFTNQPSYTLEFEETSRAPGLLDICATIFTLLGNLYLLFLFIYEYGRIKHT